MNAYAEYTTTALPEVDAEIAELPRGPLTLDPDRGAATPVSQVVARLADSTSRPHLAAAASAVARAQIRSFPENLLWDFDFFVASIHAEAAEAPDYLAHLESLTKATVELMRLYGQHSMIRFRYVHDFIYGFDWARWVRRDPERRAGVGPFSLQFLRQSESRGRDLLTLIESDDRIYPKLRGDGARNPFPFSREPEEELRLYRLLSACGCIPVEAWRFDACPDASRDFDALRESAASDLGLTR